MKVTVEYNVNMAGDLADDEARMKMEMRGVDLTASIYDMKSNLREKLKYADLTEEQYTIVEKISDEFREILGSYNIDVDDLYR